MKKLLAMCLVLSMASAANAILIDTVAPVLQVVTNDIGQSGGRTGTYENPLQPSDVIGVAIIIGHNPYYTTYSPYGPLPTYDGYLVSSVDLDLHAVGPGSLSVNTLKTGAPNVSTDLDSLDLTLPVNGDIPRMQGISLAGIGPSEFTEGWSDVIAEGILFHCDGPGQVLLDLTLFGLTEYSPYKDLNGGPFPDGWLPATEEDLGDLIIYQIPEPITMALLGLGGLGLLRRRR